LHIQEADRQWEALCKERDRRLAPVKAGIKTASTSVASASKAVDQLNALLPRGPIVTAQRSLARKLSVARADLASAATTFSGSVLPATSELEMSAKSQLTRLQFLAKATESASHTIRKTSPKGDLRAVTEKVASIAKEATSMAREATTYASRAVKAEAEYIATASALSRARVGAVLLETSPYPEQVMKAAIRVTGSLDTLQGTLLEAQTDLTSGKLTQAKSVARRYESLVERGQAAALKSLATLAKKHATAAKSISTRQLEVDTSGRVVVKVGATTSSAETVEQLQQLIDEVAKSETIGFDPVPPIDRNHNRGRSPNTGRGRDQGKDLDSDSGSGGLLR
jgi:hypothetical protein